MGLFSPKKKTKYNPKTVPLKNMNAAGSSKRAFANISPENQSEFQMPKAAKTDEVKFRSMSQSLLPEYWLSTQNKFGVLSTDGDESNDKLTSDTIQPEKEVRIPKPPPLFIHGVEEIINLETELKKSVEARYTIKAVGPTKIKLQLETKADYQKVVEMLTAKKTKFTHFQLKELKAFRVVLKGVHPKTDKAELTAALKDAGHDVISLAPIRSKRTSNDLPMFFVNLKQNTNNKEVFKINRLLHTVVTIEAPLNTKMDIPQCQRCQSFGHTKNYCHLDARCVKCPGNHLTAECTRKIKDTNVKCVNCDGNHSANYKGCAFYQSLRQKLYPVLKKKKAEKSCRPF